jgi:hypothetical protein
LDLAVSHSWLAAADVRRNRKRTSRFIMVKKRFPGCKFL